MVICPKDANRMTNSEDPSQTAPRGSGLHCLPRPFSVKTWDHYSLRYRHNNIKRFF